VSATRLKANTYRSGSVSAVLSTARRSRSSPFFHWLVSLNGPKCITIWKMVSFDSAPIGLPAFGRRLRRLRRLRGFKQGVVAEIAGVAQTTVSRWESGDVRPDAELAAYVLLTLARQHDRFVDAPLRRLIETASTPVHLVDDDDHRLLAASAPRLLQWGVDADTLLGRSLWPFASDAVLAAEARLEAAGWWDDHNPAPIAVDLVDADRGLRFVAGRMMWERLHLADGAAVRLCMRVD
jgi:transcriptional regulator with XRE-family HTH domain